MSYCINIKKRKNKPYCKLINKEIQLSTCRECNNKEYKKSTFIKKSPVGSGLSNNSQMRKDVQYLEKISPKKVKLHQKSNKLAKLERNRYSVFSNDTKKCYLCDSTYKLTWHEIYAGKNRSNSMEDGFCLRMCLNCHREYQDDTNFNDFWHREAQLYFEEHYGTKEDFISRYRRNYLK